MKEYAAENIRNITLIGHGGSGKTSLSELMLYTAGEINRIGTISEGNTISDYNSNEIERQFSLALSLMHLEWQNKKLNFIDTPGYSDFVGEVIAGLKVCDLAVLLLKSVEGIEVGSEIYNQFVEERKIPSAFIINKVDNERSRFFEVLDAAKEKLNHNAVIASFPTNEGINFDTVVDVIKLKSYTYGAVGSKSVSEADLSGDLLSRAEAYRTELIEKVAEQDEELMNKYLENGTLSAEELEKGLKSAIISRDLVPVFALSVSKGVGLNTFLDFAMNYFPAPNEVKAPEGSLRDKDGKIEIPCNENAEPVMFVFKTVAEQHVGELSYFKVYSGKVSPGLDLLNTNNGKSERLSQLSLLTGRNRKEIGTLHAGDLGAVVKLKDTHTNNTIASYNFPAIVDKIEFPDPSISGAIIPKAKGDEDKIANGLHTIHQEDPSFIAKFDPELSQTIIAGQGELQLSLAVKRLKERYGVEVDLVEPKIPYREAIKGVCPSCEYKHKKQSGGRGQFGHIVIKMEPLPRGGGFEFVDAIVGGVVPGRFIPAVEKGIMESMVKGVLAGCKVVDVKVTLFFGSAHPVDSDDMSFKIAGSMGFRKAFLESKPVLLEPIYEIEVRVPEENMGDVMGDISSRRGKILGMDSSGSYQLIKALVPLSELYKYSSTLRSLTQGRGGYKMKFSTYEEVPKEVENKIVEEYKKSREEA